MKKIIQHLKLNPYNYLLLLFILLCVASEIFVPIINGDTVMYTLIGKAIFTKGIAPYGYIFDHKPIAIYYIYGIASLIYPFKLGFFCLVSILFSLFIAIAINKFYPKKNGILINLFIITLLSYLPYKLSGNTELIAGLFIILSICHMMKDKNHYLAGIYGAIAFNINYLSAVCLLLPTLYDFYKSYKNKNLISIAKYFIGFSIAFVVLLIPIELLNGSTGIYNYFKEQFLFEKSYGHAYTVNRAKSLLFFIKRILVFIPPILFAFFQLKDKKIRLFLALATIGCLLATMISGYCFFHYLTFFAVICALIFIIAINKQKISINKKLIIILIFIPCTCFIVRNYLKFKVNQNIEYFKEYESNYFKVSYSKLDEIVGQTPVLPIRASHTIFYFSHIRPFTNLIFRNHAYIMSDCNHKKEDDFFVQKIKESPQFIITKHNILKNSKDIQKTIELINKNYHIILTSKGLNPFYLYKIN